jgi:hypothetical protein
MKQYLEVLNDIMLGESEPQSEDAWNARRSRAKIAGGAVGGLKGAKYNTGLYEKEHPRPGKKKE